MGDSEIKRISGREGWSDEAHEEHGPTLKQKVPEKKTCELNLYQISPQVVRFAAKTIFVLSMIALFIWQVSSYLSLSGRLRGACPD